MSGEIERPPMWAVEEVRDIVEEFIRDGDTAEQAIKRMAAALACVAAEKAGEHLRATGSWSELLMNLAAQVKPSGRRRKR